jgi:hypothetical protein
MSPLNITQPLGIWSIMAKVMSNIPKMGQLPTPVCYRLTMIIKKICFTKADDDQPFDVVKNHFVLPQFIGRMGNDRSAGTPHLKKISPWGMGQVNPMMGGFPWHGMTIT